MSETRRKPASAPDNTAKPRNLQVRDSFGRWRPGQSGNPGGRAVGAKGKATLLSEAYTRLLEQEYKDGKITFAEAIAKRLGDIAMTGKPGVAIQAAEALGSRSEGKPVQMIAVQRTSMDPGTMRRIADLAARILPSESIPPTLDHTEIQQLVDCQCSEHKQLRAQEEGKRRQDLLSQAQTVREASEASVNRDDKTT